MDTDTVLAYTGLTMMVAGLLGFVGAGVGATQQSPSWLIAVGLLAGPVGLIIGTVAHDYADGDFGDGGSGYETVYGKYGAGIAGAALVIGGPLTIGLGQIPIQTGAKVTVGLFVVGFLVSMIDPSNDPGDGREEVPDDPTEVLD